jgi:hypothetical protein
LNANQPLELLGKQWQYPGQVASVGKFTTLNTQSYYYFSTVSNGSFTDASYIRLSTLAASYSLSASYLKKAGIEACNIFINSNYLFVITKYKGIDPETQNFGGVPPVRGIVGGVGFTF